MCGLCKMSGNEWQTGGPATKKARQPNRCSRYHVLPFDIHCCHMGLSSRHLKFVTSGHSDAQPWASECPDVTNYKWRLNPVWHRMLYSCTHMATVGVKRLSVTAASSLPCYWGCHGILTLCLLNYYMIYSVMSGHQYPGKLHHPLLSVVARLSSKQVALSGLLTRCKLKHKLHSGNNTIQSQIIN